MWTESEPQHLTHSSRGRLVILMVSAVVVAGAALLVDVLDSHVLGDEQPPPGAAAPPVSVATTPATAPPPTLTHSTLRPLVTEDGLAPVITRVETTDPVVFLTIDDGITRLPEGPAAFEQLGVPASLFLINEPVESDPGFFASMPGTLVESHTQTHTKLTDLSEEEQRAEICGNADVIERTYGRRPVLFRPPFGSYDQATRRAAAACGMRAVVIWEENVNWDVVGFRSVQHFRPGDIILMHFRPQFVQELHVIKQRVEEAGLRFALLEDYLAPETVPPSLER
ncbi:MAG: polysaccharide deacetylase family protein [Acidimicrobiales bacterium]